jgi:hypothetical protein
MENAMASEVDAMGLLAQPTAMLQIASAVASALDAPVRSGNASIARRLLASSAAYRMRVRKKLLRQMSGTVVPSLTERTAAASLAASLTLLQQPDELAPDDAKVSRVEFIRLHFHSLER